MIKICSLQPQLIDYVSDDIDEFLTNLDNYSNNEYTKETVLKQLSNNELYALLILDDSEIVGICLYDFSTFHTSKKVFNLLMLGGVEMSIWFDTFHTYIKDLAKFENCDALKVFAARKGWEKFAIKHDYKTVLTQYEIAL